MQSYDEMCNEHGGKTQNNTCTHIHPPPDQMSASLISVGADVIPMQSMTLTAFGLRRDGKGRYGGSEWTDKERMGQRENYYLGEKKQQKHLERGREKGEETSSEETCKE